jgi:hypothetical protein
VNVAIDCICPGSPHEKDTISLREKLDFRQGAGIRWAVVLAKQTDPDVSTPEILALLTEGYLLEGIEAWTLVDEKRKAIAVSKPAIREHLLSNQVAATKVGDAADLLYSEVMLPLLMTAFRSSPDMPTDESTSATNGSSLEPPTPLRPSSTFTIPTDDTELPSRSLAGVSS